MRIGKLPIRVNRLQLDDYVKRESQRSPVKGPHVQVMGGLRVEHYLIQSWGIESFREPRGRPGWTDCLYSFSNGKSSIRDTATTLNPDVLEL